MVSFSQMRKVLESFHPFTEAAWQDFSALFSYTELKKGDYFVREGVRNDHLAFIIEGALRAFYLDQNGTFYNKTFFIEGSFATSLASVLQNIPSFLNFDALVDTSMLVGHYKQVEALFEKHRCIETIVRKIIEYEWVIKKEQRELRLVLNDAAERHAYFREEYPSLENKIPQYHIASHLGIRPIQLSRIRAKKS